MSNRMKIRKHKTKEEDTEINKEVKEVKEVKEAKHSAKFLKNKREKGTMSSNFSGKSSKEFSRKKV